MKITKNRLRQIIQEELVQVLENRENRGVWGTGGAWYDPFNIAGGSDKGEVRPNTGRWNQKGPSGRGNLYVAGQETDTGMCPNPQGGDWVPCRTLALRQAQAAEQADTSLGSLTAPITRDKAVPAPGNWCAPKKTRDEVNKVVKAAGLYTGRRWWENLAHDHPYTLAYNEWIKCADPAEKRGMHPGRTRKNQRAPGTRGGAPGPGPGPGEEEAVEEGICENEDVMHDTYAMYNALKGWNTDEEMVYQVLERNSNCACMKVLYANFDKLLEMKDDTDAGDLIDWLRDDGEYKAAAMVKKCMMGTDVRQIDTEWR